MKSLSLKKLVSTTVVAGAIGFSASVLDVTPESWNAHAEDQTKSQSGCANGNCSPEVKAKKVVEKDGVEKSCGAAEKKCGTEKTCGDDVKKAKKK